MYSVVQCWNDYLDGQHRLIKFDNQSCAPGVVVLESPRVEMQYTIAVDSLIFKPGGFILRLQQAASSARHSELRRAPARSIRLRRKLSSSLPGAPRYLRLASFQLFAPFQSKVRNCHLGFDTMQCATTVCMQLVNTVPLHPYRVSHVHAHILVSPNPSLR